MLTLDDLKTLKSGTPIRISDGTKQPPKHHTKKLSSWSYNNFNGYFYELNDSYDDNMIVVATNETLKGVRKVFSLKSVNIELI